MINEPVYQSFLTESVALRRELNEKLWKRMNELSKEFQDITSLSHKEFMFAKNMLYYQGGWPNPHTRPRLETHVRNFMLIVRVLHYLGREQQLLDYMREFGIEVKFVPIPGTPIQRVQSIMDEALVLQREICQKADVIKIDHALVVKEACGVVKKHYTRNVNVFAKRARGGDIENDVDDFKVEAGSAADVSKVLESG